MIDETLVAAKDGWTVYCVENDPSWSRRVRGFIFYHDCVGGKKTVLYICELQKDILKCKCGSTLPDGILAFLLLGEL